MAFHFQKMQRRLVARGHTRKSIPQQKTDELAATGGTWHELGLQILQRGSDAAAISQKGEGVYLAATRNGRQAKAALDQEHDGVGHQHDQNTAIGGIPKGPISSRLGNAKPTWRNSELC